jgi:hypothetical protein
MVAVGGVAVPVVRVVDVICVRNRVVPAAGSVYMTVLRMGHVRKRMLVVVPVMRRVRVAVMDVVGVALALGAGMPAARSVLMLGVDVRLMVRCHGSSLL